MFNSTFQTRNYCKKRPPWACHKGIWRSGRIPPLILNHFTRWAKSTFTPSNELLISTRQGPNGIDSRSGSFGYDINLSSLSGIETCFIARTGLAFLFFLTQQPLVGQGLLSIEASRSQSDTPHSVGLLWTSDQPVAETTTRQHTTFTRDRHPCPGEIRTHNPSKRAAADPHLTPRGHWDRQCL